MRRSDIYTVCYPIIQAATSSGVPPADGCVCDLRSAVPPVLHLSRFTFVDDQSIALFQA